MWRSVLRSERFAAPAHPCAMAAPTLRGFDKNISRRSGLAREFGVRFYALECSRPRPLLRSAASIKISLVGAGLPANSASGFTLWNVRGQGRSRTSCASRHLHIPVQWPLLQSGASIKQSLVGAGLPANAAFGFTLWKVRGQGRSRTSDLQGWRKCKRIVGNNPCLCFVAPAHPCAMAALAIGTKWPDFRYLCE